MWRTHFKQGFGLAEVILAMFVLSVGMITVVSPIVSNIPILTETRNFVVADGLAQEGIALVRNVRDNDFLNGTNNGFTDFPSPGTTPKNCVIDYASNLDCAGADHRYLVRSGNFYQSTSVKQKFDRKVVIDTTDSGKSYEVTSYVVWDPGALSSINSVSDCTRANHCAYAQTVLSGWKFW